MFFNFVWDGKGDKVKHDIMINDYENGGLRMIDIKIFNKALKSSWVKKYLNPENQGKWKLLFDYELQNLGGVEFFRTNLNKQDLLKTIKNLYLLRPLLQKYSSGTITNALFIKVIKRLSSTYFGLVIYPTVSGKVLNNRGNFQSIAIYRTRA